MSKIYYSYNEFRQDIKELASMLQDKRYDAILAVARGGLTIGHFLALALDKRELFALNSIHYNNNQKLDSIKLFNIPNLDSYKRVLIVDDIVDSGDTMEAILERLNSLYPNKIFDVATIFYKKGAKIEPKYALKEANEWIDFFWEVDALLD
jgi:xanthine phosphoribosyltransferase